MWRPRSAAKFIAFSARWARCCRCRRADRVWELWSDPRKLERWWGPPDHPATVETHDLSPGGQVKYLMTGPEGETHHGVWRVNSLDPPTSLEFTDAFAETDGTPIGDMPVSTISVRLVDRGRGTRREMRAMFESREDMNKWVGTGSVEGLQEAVGQIDVLLYKDEPDGDGRPAPLEQPGRPACARWELAALGSGGCAS